MRCYEYTCDECGVFWDVYKNMSDIDRPEPCSECGKDGRRCISRTTFYGADEWDKPEYNPALGCVTKNRLDRKRKAKERGMEEVGNDFGSADAMVDHYEKEREARIEKSWENV